MDAICKMSKYHTTWPCSARACPLFGDCYIEYEKAIQKPQTNAERMISLIQNGKVRDLLDWWEEIFEDGVPGDDYFEWWLNLPVKEDNE